jgi:hypothetical protein
MYILNPNYVIIVKQDIDKLLTPIVIIPKKNGKLKLIQILKIKCNHKKGSIPIPLIDEILNTIARYEAYSFLDGYSRSR